MKTTSLQKLVLFSICGALSACAPSLDKLVDDPQKGEDATPQTLTRDWKTVVRYDCDGNVISNKVETISPPRKLISIRPKDYTNLFASNFKNKTTDSVPGLVLDRVKFTIDMAPTLFNMQVNEGVNEIHYEFLYCDKPELDGNGTYTGKCSIEPEIREAGNLYIKVVYQQNWLTGEIHSKPSPTDCPPLTE